MRWMHILLLAILCTSVEAGAEERKQVLSEFSKIACDDEATEGNGYDPTGDCGGLKILLFERKGKLVVEYTVCEGGCKSRDSTAARFDHNSGHFSFVVEPDGLRFIGTVKGDSLEGTMIDPYWGPNAFEIKLHRKSTPTNGSTRR